MHRLAANGVNLSNLTNITITAATITENEKNETIDIQPEPSNAQQQDLEHPPKDDSMALQSSLTLLLDKNIELI